MAIRTSNRNGVRCQVWYLPTGRSRVLGQETRSQNDANEPTNGHEYEAPSLSIHERVVMADAGYGWVILTVYGGSRRSH